MVATSSFVRLEVEWFGGSRPLGAGEIQPLTGCIRSLISRRIGAPAEAVSLNWRCGMVYPCLCLDLTRGTRLGNKSGGSLLLDIGRGKEAEQSPSTPEQWKKESGEGRRMQRVGSCATRSQSNLDPVHVSGRLGLHVGPLCGGEAKRSRGQNGLPSLRSSPNPTLSVDDVAGIVMRDARVQLRCRD